MAAVTLRAIHARVCRVVGQDCSINSSHGLLALLAHSISVLEDDARWADRVRAHLDDALVALQSSPVSTSFYRSAPGLGWLLCALARDVGFDDGIAIGHELGEMFLQRISDSSESSLDVINGVAGLAV